MPVRGTLRPARRLILACLIAGPVLAFLTGCANVTPVIEPATITFAFHQVDSRYYEGLLGEFSDRYPHITVELYPMSWDQVGNVGPDDGDVLAADMRVLSYLYDQRALLGLDPFLEQDSTLDVDDFYPGTLAALTREGRVWAIPAGVDVVVMYLNEDLFDLYGAAYPSLDWSWPEFLDRALATRDETSRVYGYTTIPGHWDAVLFIYQHGGRLVDNEHAPTRIVCDDPLTIDALEWYAQLFHEYDVAPTPMEARAAFGGGNYTYYQGIRNGRVGMWALPISQRGGMMWPVEWLSEWRVATPPQDIQRATSASIEAFAISSETDHPDASWLWISFLSRQMTYRLVPPRRSLAESEDYERVVGEEIAVVARASLDDAVLFGPTLWTHLGDDLEIFSDAVGKIVAGDMTAAEAMDWADQNIGDQ